ncbi:GNAT family N-acetyltransferase [Pseudothauera rhizosphaerae]|uniref:N-acetyltransferase n=1 Tax=Pseudothauera rhizosphaerae TaxID=2565932 RepID=A0A4S4APM1_9RHOO|nr:GNAT family N-acetyltransferase [Pseudothauera rhizosphaerae]THF61646.1 N-acetyltransferase [Pseudothauera rhizosphaerae]
MADIEITREDSPTRGRCVGRIAGIEGEAELTFSKAGPELLIADHTGVPDTMRETGAGTRLAQRLVDDARAGGYRILALCPFVRAQTQRHPEAGRGADPLRRLRGGW